MFEELKIVFRFLLLTDLLFRISFKCYTAFLACSNILAISVFGGVQNEQTIDYAMPQPFSTENRDKEEENYKRLKSNVNYQVYVFHTPTEKKKATKHKINKNINENCETLLKAAPRRPCAVRIIFYCVFSGL